MNKFELVRGKYYRPTLKGKQIKSLYLFFTFQNDARKFVFRIGQKVKCFFGMLEKCKVLSNHMVFIKLS